MRFARLGAVPEIPKMHLCLARAAVEPGWGHIGISFLAVSFFREIVRDVFRSEWNAQPALAVVNTLLSNSTKSSRLAGRSEGAFR